jgi:hypothetical protein
MPAVYHPALQQEGPPMSGGDTTKVTPARLRRDAYLYQLSGSSKLAGIVFPAGHKQ